MDNAAAVSWPVSGLADAVEQLARAGRVVSETSQRSTAPSPRQAAEAEAVEGGVEGVSRRFDFEAESADVTYSDVTRTLQHAAPALLKVNAENGSSFLAVVSSSGRTVTLLAPDGRRHRILTKTVAAWLKRALEAPIQAQLDQLLADANVPPANRAAARQALLDTHLATQTATRCWMLRPAPAASLWHHMRYARLPRRLVIFILAYAAATLASAGAWRLIGGAALEGLFDPITLLAWSFLLLSIVPLAVFAMWSQGIFMLGVSGILKLQLLAGALKLEPDDTRHQGVGQHLARVIESDSLEALVLTGGFYALTAIFDLLLALVIFLAIGHTELAGLLLLVVAMQATGAYSYFRRRNGWTTARLQLTHDLVERMVGHRTRLVQGSTERPHEDEDEALERYVEYSKRMDRGAMVLAAVPKSWLLLGLAGLAPQFIDVGVTPGILAASIGVTLLAYGALAKLTASFATLSDAAISWRQVRPLIESLRRPEVLGHVDVTAESINSVRSTRSGPLITAQDLAFRFRERTDPVLQHCSFRIGSGDRIHLSGASGGGKSTLVSLLTGLRVPDSGLLLLDGLDRATLGTRAWRKRVAAAPQFHENHLFTESLAFNLLMGRRWPPTADDLRWAEVVCRRLGLGPLIDRMPGGLFHLVGETGWQLSHGERSRVYMARALLQGADLVVLDESFAELDPDNLQRCLPEAAELSRSMLVVAHT